MSCRTERPLQKELRKKRKEAQIREERGKTLFYSPDEATFGEKKVGAAGRKEGRKDRKRRNLEKKKKKKDLSLRYFALRHHNVRCALYSLSQSPHHSHNHHHHLLLLWESPAPPSLQLGITTHSRNHVFDRRSVDRFIRDSDRAKNTFKEAITITNEGRTDGR